MAFKYRFVAEEIEKTIPKLLKEGRQKLPSEDKVCQKYGVSRQTVREALSLLEEKGLIKKHKGSGSHITGLLSKPEQNRIAILVADSGEYIYPKLICELSYFLQDSGFTVEVHDTHNSPFRERRILTSLLANPPRGILVECSKSALPTPNADLYYLFQSRQIPIVFLFNRYRELTDFPCIWDDNTQGSMLLVKHLHSLGHEKIAGIFKSDDLQGHLRYKGYVDTMMEEGLNCHDTNICWYTSSEIDALEKEENRSFLDFFVRNKLADSTAVICYNDEIAYHLLYVLKQNGYHLPGDMTLVSFDNTYLSNAGEMSVTTLTHKPREVSRKACEAILAKIKGLPVSDSLLPWEINRQESSFHL